MITSERLIFCKPYKEDFEQFYKINSKPENNLFNPYGSMKQNVAENIFQKILKHWEDNKFGLWKIYERNKNNNIIGFGGLSYRLYGNNIKLNLGFRLDKLYWNNGYATEIGNKGIEFGFNTLNKKEIYGLVRPNNLASIRVLEKCGMTIFSKINDVPNQEESIIYRISTDDKITMANNV